MDSMTNNLVEADYMKDKHDELRRHDGIYRCNKRGCKASEFNVWPHQSLQDMDSLLAVQMYIQQTIRKNHLDIDEILRLPPGQDLDAWKYEHVRQFCMQLNRLATMLQKCCKPETCSQMTATEQWIFLCAAHKQPTECPAIDYTRHTLEGAASLLNSNKYFPSRVTIKDSSVAKLGSISRRIYRIFSHTYYHHIEVYEEFEKQTLLCKRFTEFVLRYDMVSKDNIIVPVGEETPKPVLSTVDSNTTVIVASNADEPRIQTEVESGTATIKLSAVAPSPAVETESTQENTEPKQNEV